MRRHLVRFVALTLVSASLSVATQGVGNEASARPSFDTYSAEVGAVHGVYQDFMGRNASPDELQRFVPRLGIGQTVTDVRARVLASRNFFRRVAGKSRTGYVIALYEQVRGRAPTTNELTSGKRQLFRSKKTLVQRRLDLAEQVLTRSKYDPDGFGVTEIVLNTNSDGDITRFAFEVDTPFSADDVTVTVSIKGQQQFGTVRVRAFENIVSLVPYRPVPRDGKIVGLVFFDDGNSVRIADLSTPSRSLPPRVEPRDSSWPETVFDSQRIVAYYGNHLSRPMGILGETGPEAAVNRVKTAAARFDEPGRPGTGAFEMIVTVAQATAGGDGNYSHPSKLEDVARWIDVAEREGLYVILDIQPGRSDFFTESFRYRELLMRPNVGLALDPEWRMGPTQRPGQTVGSVTAEEVNRVSAWLSDLVLENDLPEKMFIVHQFQSRMIKNREQLIDRPGLATIIHADGFGGRAIKMQTYSIIHTAPPFYNGFKLFIDEDTRMFLPHEVLAFDPLPVPDLITYQ